MQTATQVELADLAVLNREVTSCTQCPRLIAHCRKIGAVKRRAYLDWEYWAKPVPGFGDINARVLVLGLAPGAHGSNRTGRMFTGDGSANFLYPVLHKVGFASHHESRRRDDGMKLTNAYITAMARCAPPGNKPSPQELANCSTFLDRELALLKNLRIVVALGKIAFDGYLNHLKRHGIISTRAGYDFGHGVEYKTPDGRALLASYHPSIQNTNTGKLTEQMFLNVFRRAARLVSTPRS